VLVSVATHATVNDVPGIRDATPMRPGVPPSACAVRKIRELAVTLVFGTACVVPPVSVNVPCFAFAPSATFSPAPACGTSNDPTPVDTPPDPDTVPRLFAAMFPDDVRLVQVIAPVEVTPADVTDPVTVTLPLNDVFGLTG